MPQKIPIIVISGFVAGVSVSSFVDFGWTLALLFVFLGGIFGAVYFWGRSKVFGAIALLFLAVGLGQLRYGQRDLSGRQSDLQNKIGQRVLLAGIVSDEPEQKGKLRPIGFGNGKQKQNFSLQRKIILNSNTATN